MTDLRSGSLSATPGISTDGLIVLFGRVPRPMGQVFLPGLVQSTVGSEDFTGVNGPINLLGARVRSYDQAPCHRCATH